MILGLPIKNNPKNESDEYRRQIRETQRYLRSGASMTTNSNANKDTARPIGEQLQHDLENASTQMDITPSVKSQGSALGSGPGRWMKAVHLEAGSSMSPYQHTTTLSDTCKSKGTRAEDWHCNRLESKCVLSPVRRHFGSTTLLRALQRLRRPRSPRALSHAPEPK